MNGPDSRTDGLLVTSLLESDKLLTVSEPSTGALALVAGLLALYASVGWR